MIYYRIGMTWLLDYENQSTIC